MSESVITQKKRGRKSTQSKKKMPVVYSSTDIVAIDLKGVQFDKHVIIQLNVKKDDLEKSNDGPKPYSSDMAEFAPVENKKKEILPKSSESNTVEYSETVSEVYDGNFVIMKNLINIMYEFIDSNKKNEWPKKVNIDCSWCCFPFSTPPCAIPVKYIKGVFYLKDNFCSFNCAAAQIFHDKEDNMWEQYSLLNLLYKKMYNTSYTKIKPAPMKKMLTRFGGPWSIEHFRKKVLTNSNIYKFILPPMVALIPKLEEDIVDVNRKYENYVPINNEAIKGAETALRLKREKPIIKKEKTLHAFMKIKRI